MAKIRIFWTSTAVKQINYTFNIVILKIKATHFQENFKKELKKELNYLKHIQD